MLFIHAEALFLVFLPLMRSIFTVTPTMLCIIICPPVHVAPYYPLSIIILHEIAHTPYILLLHSQGSLQHVCSVGDYIIIIILFSLDVGGVIANLIAYLQ